MVTKGTIVALVVIVLLITIFLRGRGSAQRKLSTDEETIRRLIHETYGDKITAESITYKDGDALMTITLRDDKLENLDVNISSLARKHRDQGVSLPVIKKSLEF
jgi:hypothetical protein